MKKVIYLLLFSFIFSANSLASTNVCGDVFGTWDITGSPYYVICDCTVPTGQELVIEPGVNVIFGVDLSLYVNGVIIAEGTETENITFDSPSDLVKWGEILINYGPSVSKFEYCKINNAETGINLKICCKKQGTMTAEIRNSIFLSCTSQGIYGQSIALSDWNASHNTYLSPIIENCVFDSTNNGIVFYADGYSAPYSATSTARISPIVKNCIFRNLADTSFKLTKGDNVGNSTPVFCNNTIFECDSGIFVQNPFDVIIKNNMFYDCATAVERTGNLSGYVEYNCFHYNDTDFIGYPTSYGQIVMYNKNGDLCDIASNIFMDPLFTNEDDLMLTMFSPCIDAGDPEDDYAEEPEPNGGVINIGAYGGTPQATLSPFCFDNCISELCQSEIIVTVIDPDGGILSYTWDPIDGGEIIGTGDHVLFSPPDNGPYECPYQIRLVVESSTSGKTYEDIIYVYVKIAGDADGSGMVDILDKRLVRDAYGSQSGDANWDPRADVNCSGRVDILDKRVVRDQYGDSGCACP